MLHPPLPPRNRRRLLLLFLLAAAFLLGGGCEPGAGASTASRDTTVTDALGRGVRLAVPARRAVTLAPNLTEIVFAAGADSRLAGVSTADDFPPAVDTLARVAAYPQIDFEQVAALRPDLVLATDQVNAPRDAATLEQLGAPAYFFSFSSVQDVFDAVRTTGRLLGTPRKARRAADSLEAAARALRRRTTRALKDSSAGRPLVLFLVGDRTLYTFAEGSYVHELIRWAGGKSATAGLASNAPLSEEFVLEKQPDVIVGAFGADYDPARLLELHPAWDVVPAVREGRVFSVPPALFLRPGPRLIEGARRLARLLHPSLFGS